MAIERFRPSRRFVLASLCAFLAACAATREQPKRVEPARPTIPIHLVVLHTNDMHGQVLPRKATWLDKTNPPLIGGLPRVAAFIDHVRKQEANETTAVLVVDAGDWYQGTPEGVIERGFDFVSAISAIGYDATCVGNHEWDHGVDNLQRLLKDAKPPAICSNVRIPTSGARVPWVEPWRIVNACGLRIALVGLLTPSTPSITHKDASKFLFEAPVDAIARAKAELAGKYDLLIPVGHIGLEEGACVARANPELALIVTGHSHTYLKEGQREGSVLLVQAGSKASAVGRVDMWVEPATMQVRDSNAQLFDLLEEPAAENRNAVVEAICARLAEQSAEELGQVVGELSGAIRGGRGPFSTIAGNWIADMMRTRTGADVGLHNRGGTRAEIEAGPVTRRQVFEILPFDNNLVTLTLTGAQLESCVRGSLEGTTHSGLDYSGLRAFVNVTKDGAKTLLKVERIEVGGMPLERDKSYRVTTNSFLAGGGDSFDELVNATDRVEDPILLRDMAIEEFQRVGKITPPSDERIVDVAASKP